MKKGKRNSTERSKEVVLNVTQKDYEKEIASGVAPGDAMKPGKHVFRRGGFLERHGKTAKEMQQIIADSRNTKAVITMRIDSDVLEFFRRIAGKPGAPGYQTQMNDALRTFMERDAGEWDYVKLIENEKFIAAVADKVRATEKVRSKRSA